MVDVLDELRHALWIGVDDGPDLDSLGEFVDGNQEVIKSLGGFLNSPIMSTHQTMNGQVMGII
jgi:hypothetical protein